MYKRHILPRFIRDWYTREVLNNSKLFEKYLVTGRFSFWHRLTTIGDTSAGIKVPDSFSKNFIFSVFEKSSLMSAVDCEVIENNRDRSLNRTIFWDNNYPGAPENFTRTGKSMGGETLSDIPLNLILFVTTIKNRVYKNLKQELLESLTETMSNIVNQLIVNGNGQGKISGVFNDEQVKVFSIDNNFGLNEMVDAVYSLPEKYQEDAKWYMSTRVGLILNRLRDWEGNFLVEGNRIEPPAEILGFEIVYIDSMFNEEFSNLVKTPHDERENNYHDLYEAAAGHPVIFGDLGKAYKVIYRKDLAIRIFEDPANIENDEKVYLARVRIGGGVVEPKAVIGFNVKDI